jgi:histidinol-phosphate aminotransferase
VVDVPLQGPEYALDVSATLAAITDRTRIIAVTSPNNPTGTIIPRQTLEMLLDALPEDILLIYDEVYRHFVDDPSYTMALPYIQAGKPILALNSFSKTYGLAALRLGYAYTTEEIAAYIRQIIKPFNIPVLSMEAALAALSDQAFVDRTVEVIQTERRWLENQFRELGVSFTPSQANFILVDPPVQDDAFVSFLVEGGIMTRPVTNFGAPGKVRITIGPREANQRLVRVLGKLLESISYEQQA